MRSRIGYGKMATMAMMLLIALAVQGKDAFVFVAKGSAQKAIHRFKIENIGATNETWTETTPLCTFTSGQGVNGVFPAHGYYYVCIGATVYRYSKDGQQLAKIGGMGSSTSFEMSADQAYIYGSSMTLSEGKNCVRRLHLGNGNQAVIITNNIAQARGLSWGKDGLLYVSSRSNGSGEDYYGNPITTGQYRGLTAFDVTNGDIPLLKHHYTLPSSWGHVVVNADLGCIYGCGGGNVGYVFGIAEESPDGETSQIWRAQPAMSLNNCFAGALISGYAYAADWKDAGANVYRFNHDGTATLVTTILNTDVGGDGTLSTIQSIHEDAFPEEDTTIALTKLSDYWSFNHYGETSTIPGTTFTSQVNPRRFAVITSGFTAGVRGAEREGLWCAAGAKGTLASAVLVAPTNDWSIVAWVGFPTAMDGAQTLFSNPKMTISVTAEGQLKADMPNGKDIAGEQATGASATGTTSLADGAWHQVAIMRRGYKLEVWVDGALEATSAETKVATYDDLKTQWSLLSTANRNKMFLDEVRFYGAALAANDLKLLKGLATKGLPVPRDSSTRSDAAAQAIGNVVAYSDPTNHTWGVPMVLADADGSTLYVAADFARTNSQNNQSVIWKSTDGGENWSRVMGVPLGALTLFRFDSDVSGTFRTIGYDNDGSFAWGWSTANGCASFTTPKLQSTTPLPGAWYPAPCPTGYARNVALDSGFFNLNAIAYNQGYFIGCPVALSNLYNVAGYRSGSAFEDERGTPTAFYHETVSRHVNATNAVPLEILGVVRREAERGLVYRGTATFPGASRPFGVIWDSTSARYWAVVTYAEDDSLKPWERANRLALYSAKDLTAWEKCSDIAVAGTPATVGFNTPNLIALGDDLIVVFGASVNDSTGEAVARDVNRSNYILSKRITNFRQLAPADDERRTRTLLVGDNVAGRIIRLEEDPDNPNRWLNAGYFAYGTFSYGSGTDTMGGCDDIKYSNHKVWILKNGRLYCFNTDGSFTEICHDLTQNSTIVPRNPDGFGLSRDGRYAYSCSAFIKKTDDKVKYIYRTDLTTGETIQFCKSTDENMAERLYQTRAVEGLPDGSVAVACRDGNKVFRLTAEGKYIAGSDVTISQPQALFYDRRSQLLYVSGFSNKLFSWNYRTGEVKEKGGMSNIIGITGDGKGRVFGTGYNNPAGIADLLADNGAFSVKGHREILLGGNYYHRCCFFDSLERGMILILK